MLRLSVIIPVFMVDDCLADCLDSLLGDPSADKGGQLEIIAVDDCSPDNSASILDAYAAFDSRLTIVRTAHNSGSGPARNLGFASATGDYVWFVDADDQLAPGAVGAVLRRLGACNPVKRPDVLLVGHEKITDHDVIQPGDLANLVATAPVNPADFRLAEWPGIVHYTHTPWTKVVRRRFLADSDLTFPTGWYTDLPWTYGLLHRAERIATLPAVTYRWRQRRTGSITRTQDRRHFDVFAQWERVWADVGDAVEEPVRSELFARMAWHLLLVAGNEERLHARDRRFFFKRAVAMYRQYFPAHGYRIPGGVNGVKQRLLASGSYPGYAAMRLLWRAWNGTRRSSPQQLAAPSQQTSPQTLGRATSRDQPPSPWGRVGA